MSRLRSGMAARCKIRLTGAEPERTLRLLSLQFRLIDVDWESGLVVSFWADRKDQKHIYDIASKNGDKIEIVEQIGFVDTLRHWMQYPVLFVVIAVLISASIILPSRILFIRVEGNVSIPDSLILEKSAQCGLSFGMSRAVLRSEQVKNQLLSALPELSWVGVNTVGCRATISVQERQREPVHESPEPGNIVASADAIITDITATAGRAVCAIGEAVKKDQVLISGYTDMGLCTHVEAAEGEVYGLTSREIRAVQPVNTWRRTKIEDIEKKYALIFGKKRINFYSDSGILYPTCGKMTQIRYLRLPGGWELPVALVIETYTPAHLSESGRWELTAQNTLREESLRQIMQEMTAGVIIRTSETEFYVDYLYGLQTVYECREMIARRSSVILTEGDTQYDGENRERGAG